MPMRDPQIHLFFKTRLDHIWRVVGARIWVEAEIGLLLESHLHAQRLDYWKKLR